MPRLQRVKPAGRVSRTAEPISLYGWDSQSETWHGPSELGCGIPDTRLLQALEGVAGKSWYGAVNCCKSHGLEGRFFALVHDLSDCATASIYCGESKAGPAEILAVIPAGRRARLRDEFAFEFVSFARFLGSISAGAELRVHDAIASAIAEEPDSRTIVFSISSGLWPEDLEPVLSRCVEKIAVTLCQWLAEPSQAGIDADPGSINAA